MNDKPVGVTLSWGGKPTLVFADGTILFKGADRILYPEYYPNGEEWAINPHTGLKMEIYIPHVEPRKSRWERFKQFVKGE